MLAGMEGSHPPQFEEGCAMLVGEMGMDSETKRSVDGREDRHDIFFRPFIECNAARADKFFRCHDDSHNHLSLKAAASAGVSNVMPYRSI